MSIGEKVLFKKVTCSFILAAGKNAYAMAETE